MSRRLVGIVAVVAVVAAVEVLTVGVADAATINATTSIGVTADGAHLAGKVASGRAACAGQRSIVLSRKRSGQASFTKLASTRTTSAGRWSFRTTLVAQAQYRATLAAKKLSLTTTCRAVT